MRSCYRAATTPRHTRTIIARSDSQSNSGLGSGGVLKEATATERVIKLRWADGRPVKMDLHDPMRKGANPDGDDDE